uniref:Uncharacterized protein n=1 Tax=Anguilla anguilla TaxID=7936 RepID=A0A0E9WM11_ANGAN
MVCFHLLMHLRRLRSSSVSYENTGVLYFSAFSSWISDHHSHRAFVYLSEETSWILPLVCQLVPLIFHHCHPIAAVLHIHMAPDLVHGLLYQAL